MSQLRYKLLTIEQHGTNEGLLSRIFGSELKAAEKQIIKDLGEKVTIANEKGQVQNWILRSDDTGTKYHLEGGDARISPEDMKARKAAEPRKEPSLPPEVTEPHPTLLGPDGKPLQVPAKPKPAITDPVVKAIADVPISTDVPAIVNMGSLHQYFLEHKPEELKRLVQNPTANKGFWNAVTEKAKNNKGKIAIATLLLLLYFWASPDKKKDTEVSSTANAGGKTSEDGSAPVGTVIPADQVPWKWVVTGSTDPNVDLDKIKNGREAYEPVKSQSVTKNESGKWQTPNGKVLNSNNGPAAERLEKLAKMDPEKRKEMAKAENKLVFNNVELYRPGEDGPKLPVVPPVESDTANKEPEQGPDPEIVLATGGKCPAGYTLSKDGKTCEKEVPAKKKKKDPKVLPTIKW
jgi:hypothetical protein